MGKKGIKDIDGKEARLYRANGMYMALELQAGQHKVELSYHTPWLREGAGLSLAALFSIVLYIVRMRRRTRRMSIE